MPHIIYCIIDPRDSRPFYIGRTSNLELRKRQHIETGHGASGLHIDQIKDNGFIPLFAVLENCNTYARAVHCETFWIEIFQSRGVSLLNKENTHARGPANAGKPWTHEADLTLTNLYRDRTPLKKICAQMGRTRGSIKLRLQRLGL